MGKGNGKLSIRPQSEVEQRVKIERSIHPSRARRLSQYAKSIQSSEDYVLDLILDQILPAEKVSTTGSQKGSSPEKAA